MSATPVRTHELLRPWFEANARDLPWRHPEFGTWGTLVSEVMLQQTQASRVAAEIGPWLARWPTPAALAEAPTAQVITQWGTLGYPRRAVRLQQCAQALVERHDGRVPREVPALLALPGIGDYTARAVAVFGFGDRHPVVDTNVRRVVARFVHGRAEPGPASGRDLRDVEALLPPDRERAALVSIALMELGALVCTARSPKCDRCPLQGECAWFAAGRPPHTGARAPRQARFEGSDRQARGRVLRLLREADGRPVSVAEVAVQVILEEQRERAISSLVSDGLAVRDQDLLRLP